MDDADVQSVHEAARIVDHTQRRRNIGSATSSGTTHWWTKELLPEPKVLQRSGRFQSDSSMEDKEEKEDE